MTDVPPFTAIGDVAAVTVDWDSEADPTCVVSADEVPVRLDPSVPVMVRDVPDVVGTV